MKYIKIEDDMKTIGSGDGTLWANTNDVLKLIARNGKHLNTGTNVLIAKSIFEECTKVSGGSGLMNIGSQKGSKYKSRYIRLEDNWYEVLMRDFVEFSFSEIGLVGVAFVGDIEAISNPLSEDPEDDGEWTPNYGEKKTETIIQKVLEDTK